MTDEKDDSKPPWYAAAFEKYGLPTVFLGVVVYMIWQAGSWAGSTVIVPIFNKQMLFIDKAATMTEEMHRTTSIINKTLEAHGQHAVESLKVCHDIKDTVNDTNVEVKVMKQSHDQIVDVLKSIDENTRPLRTGMP